VVLWNLKVCAEGCELLNSERLVAVTVIVAEREENED